MRNIDKVYIKDAEDLANTSQCHYKLGAVLVVDKRPVSSGYNKSLSLDKVLTRYGMLYTLHAEMDAIRKVYDIPYGATLYVARRDFKMARPCKDCMKIIKKTRITRIVYSTGDGIAEEKLT